MRIKNIQIIYEHSYDDMSDDIKWLVDNEFYTKEDCLGDVVDCIDYETFKSKIKKYVNKCEAEVYEECDAIFREQEEKMEDMLQRIAYALSDRCKDCPCKDGCNAVLMSECVNRIMIWLRYVAEFGKKLSDKVEYSEDDWDWLRDI